MKVHTSRKIKHVVFYANVIQQIRLVRGDHTFCTREMEATADHDLEMPDMCVDMSVILGKTLDMSK